MWMRCVQRAQQRLWNWTDVRTSACRRQSRTCDLYLTSLWNKIIIFSRGFSQKSESHNVFNLSRIQLKINYITGTRKLWLTLKVGIGTLWSMGQICSTTCFSYGSLGQKRFFIYKQLKRNQKNICKMWTFYAIQVSVSIAKFYCSIAIPIHFSVVCSSFHTTMSDESLQQKPYG